ncbi:MAG: helix-turn-helix domain-containing protein [Chloroflexi bacterium]|nr:helix-turn-helix domain-containing protein [Chloroflexota bacterium]
MQQVLIYSKDLEDESVGMRKGNDSQYCTVSEAARLLEVSPSTVWRWIEAERLPAYRVGPRNIRIKKEDLDRVITPARKEVIMDKETDRPKVLSAEPKSRRLKKELLSFAGVWKDLDVERMIDDLYKARHEAPASSPTRP